MTGLLSNGNPNSPIAIITPDAKWRESKVRRVRVTQEGSGGPGSLAQVELGGAAV